MSATTVREQALLDDQTPYVRTGRRDTARARWRLRAVRADIAEFGSAEDPDLARAHEELYLLETAEAARP
ncbi:MULTISPECIES: hypothetical protein [Nocardiopsis]|jgi:hypothetical protein|uniref:Uncharacterized protein n=1 Tax=Nocardiopsis sinuspersici TaxID=501010 RepID=A0A1V3BYQ7_9ACTN|nr:MULTISPECIES: hypothetical protein [Nocardiopsis]NYH54741.1 hypothetical protein [Nocardiopsis sinuspersici]OOC53502.1 hypothetical protein NOSIN_06525 [Nocardiopsis sinuspersici]